MTNYDDNLGAVSAISGPARASSQSPYTTNGAHCLGVQPAAIMARIAPRIAAAVSRPSGPQRRA